MEKLPPIEKVYEAWSASADGRIEVNEEEREAIVFSSDRRRQYTVSWEGSVYSSDDNATFWANYPGYPVLALWMEQGILPKEEDWIRQFQGIPWKQLNEQYKRHYDKAAFAAFEARSIDPITARKKAEEVLRILESLDLSVKRGRKKKAK